MITSMQNMTYIIKKNNYILKLQTKVNQPSLVNFLN
jgi:hypothetical protein